MRPVPPEPRLRGSGAGSHLCTIEAIYVRSRLKWAMSHSYPHPPTHSLTHSLSPATKVNAHVGLRSDCQVTTIYTTIANLIPSRDKAFSLFIVPLVLPYVHRIQISHIKSTCCRYACQLRSHAHLCFAVGNVRIFISKFLFIRHITVLHMRRAILTYLTLDIEHFAHVYACKWR